MQYRIAFISEHASPLATLGGVDAGGQNVYVGQLARQLAALGYEVDVYTRMDNERLPKVVQWMPGVRVVHVKAGPACFVAKERLLDHMPEFRDDMLQFIRAGHLQYALIHANFFMSAWVAQELRSVLHIPYVVTFHALGHVRRIHQGEADQFPASRLQIEEDVARMADHIIAECPQDQDDLCKYYHAPPSRISMIPCGFDPLEFYPVDQQLARMLTGIAPEAMVILQLGRMVPRKGVDNVIQALGLLKDTHRQLQLVVVGGASANPGEDPEVQRLQQLAAGLGVELQVIFAGQQPREKLKYYYSAADAFITTPWYEPFGITPLEAMACGTPVIGANVGGIKFSVADGETGYLVRPKDPQALAARIADLLGDKVIQREMGANAIRRVHALFTWAGVARKMSAVYEKVILARSREAVHTDHLQLIDDAFNGAARMMRKAGLSLRVQLLAAGRCMVETLRRGNKILICGADGSVAASQHFAAQLTGRFQASARRSFPAMSLRFAPGAAYEEVFSRQVEAYGQPGDLLVCLTPDGNDSSIVQAMATARRQAMHCIALLGSDGGQVLHYADIDIVAPPGPLHRIQELHMNIVHTLTDIVENELCDARQEQPLDDLNVAV